MSVASDPGSKKRLPNQEAYSVLMSAIDVAKTLEEESWMTTALVLVVSATGAGDSS